MWDIHLFALFPCRVRTKFSVVDDDGEGKLMRTRSRPRKLGASSQKAELGKEWKASKSTSYRQNIDTSLLHNNAYQNENTGHITPLPPPLVSIKVHLTPKYFFRLNNSLHLFETHCAFLPLFSPNLDLLQAVKVTKSGHHLFHDRASKGYGSIPGLMSQTYLHACLQRLNMMQISL